MIPQSPNDLEKYREYISGQNPDNCISLEDIEQYNPDKMDCRAHWESIVEKFGILPICGDSRLDPTDIEGSIYINTELHLTTGAFLYIPYILRNHTYENRCKILEIGVGYGSFPRYLSRVFDDVYSYTGIDVNLINVDMRQAELYICDGRSIPEETGNQFNYVFSGNVWQHLTIKQRHSYYKDIYEKLIPNGLFTLGAVTRPSDFSNAPDGNLYLGTWGQLTPLQSINDIMSDLQKFRFQIRQVCVRYPDIYTVFHVTRY